MGLRLSALRSLFAVDLCTRRQGLPCISAGGCLCCLAPSCATTSPTSWLPVRHRRTLQRRWLRSRQTTWRRTLATVKPMTAPACQGLQSDRAVLGNAAALLLHRSPWRWDERLHDGIRFVNAQQVGDQTCAAAQMRFAVSELGVEQEGRSSCKVNLFGASRQGPAPCIACSSSPSECRSMCLIRFLDRRSILHLATATFVAQRVVVRTGQACPSFTGIGSSSSNNSSSGYGVK